MQDKSTSIRLNGTTRDKLANIGKKGETFNDIINFVLHQRNIYLIIDLTKDEKGYRLPLRTKEEDTIKAFEIFEKIGYILPPAPTTPNMNGKTWEDEYGILANAKYREHIFEMAYDEDLIGHNRKPYLDEIIVNIYCLFEDIPAPTWSINGAMKNPFAP